MQKKITTQPRLICRYPISSHEMYSAEIEQRNVYAYDHPQDGFRMWGELVGAGEETSIPLCEVFLEYAMSCQFYGDEQQAYNQMESFGRGMGETIAEYMSDQVLVETLPNMGACALECALESLNMNFTMHQIGPELRFMIVECPFEEIARRTGLPYSELAHVGINAMCQSLLHAIQPELPVSSPVEEHVDHIFSLQADNLSKW